MCANLLNAVILQMMIIHVIWRIMFWLPAGLLDVSEEMCLCARRKERGE